MRKIIAFILFATAAVHHNAQMDIVYFDDDCYALNEAAKHRLDSLTKVIISEERLDELLITGHTDTDASDSYNKTLSANRSKSVFDYLNHKGIGNRIRMVSYGESNTVNANANDSEKALNRRVEISRKSMHRNDALLNDEEDLTQMFMIHPMKDTVLICKQGTTLWIDRNSFQTKNYNSPVCIRIKEYYHKPDFIFAHLTTQTMDKKMIESKGMIHIDVIQDGQELQLKEGSEIAILFTDRSQNDGTELFEGSEVNGEVVWVLQEKTTRTVKSDYLETPRSLERREWVEVRSYNVRRRAVKKSDKDGFTIEVDSLSIVEASEEYMNNANAMSELVMSSRKLGWINCDRFINSPQPRTDVIVEFRGELIPRICLVFKDYNSVLSHSYSLDNQYVFQNIPVGMEVEIIALDKQTDSGLIQFAMQPYYTGESEVVQLQFEERDMASIKAEVKDL